MNLKLDILKHWDDAEQWMLKLTADVVGQDAASFVIPLGKDLIYAIYKGISIELKALECHLSQEAKDAQNGSEEQAQAPAEPLPAQSDSEVLSA